MVEQSDRAPLLDWAEEISRAEHFSPGSSQHSGGLPGCDPSICRSQSKNDPNSGWSTSPGGVGSVTAVRGSRNGHSPSRRSGPDGDASGTDEEGDCAFPGSSIPNRAVTVWEEKDQIVAVFVVSFDTRSGKMCLLY